MIHVVVDDREPDDVATALTQTPETAVSRRRLPCGDYEADGRLLFERKTLADLSISIVDGRLFRQCIRMAGGPRHGVLIVEGGSRDAEALTVSRDAIQGALISISVIMGLPVLRSLDARETARLIVLTAQQVQRHISDGVKRPGYRPKGHRKRQLFVLQGIPGVGPDRARELLDHFGSIAAVFAASADDLAAVAGIGKRTAAAIHHIVHEGRSKVRARWD